VSYSVTYLAEAKAIIDLLDPEVIEKMAAGLAALREREGRLFLLVGVPGMLHMPSTTSGRSPESRPIRPVTMFRN